MPVRSRVFVIGVLAAVCCWLIAPPPAPAQDKPDFGSMIQVNDKDDPLKGTLEEAGKGDEKKYTISTDDNVLALSVGDIYSNGGKTFFKVVEIPKQGKEGGKIVWARVAGTGEPDRIFSRSQSKNPDAPPMIKVRMTMLDIIDAGGFAVYVVIGLGVVGILLAANATWVLRKRRQNPPKFIKAAEEALDSGNVEQFEDLALKERGLLPIVCRAMVERFESSTEEDIRLRTEIAAGKQVNRLRFPVKALNMIAVAAPLIGLLGTIVGMVIVFEGLAMTSGAARAAALASGIRVKLFSTASALMVAIPTLLLYFLYDSMLTGLVGQTETFAEQFMHKLLVIKRRAKAAKRRELRAGEADGDVVSGPKEVRA